MTLKSDAHTASSLFFSKAVMALFVTFAIICAGQHAFMSGEMLGKSIANAKILLQDGCFDFEYVLEHEPHQTSLLMIMFLVSLFRFEHDIAFSIFHSYLAAPYVIIYIYYALL